MIPRIVHQTWKDAKIDYWIFQRSQESVRQHLGDWEYRLWTDADLDAMMRAEFPRYYEAWLGLDLHIKRVDTARYCLMYRYGGLYADLDFVFTRGIDDLFTDDADLYFYKSTQAIVKKWDFLGNALLISRAGQKFWLQVLDYMFSLPRQTHVLSHTGPLALGKFYRELPSKPAARIFEPEIFDNERCQDGVGSRLYGYHIRTATWQQRSAPVS